MEGASLDSVGEHVRTSSAWVTPSAADREAFRKAADSGTALPSRHRSQQSIAGGRTYEQSYATASPSTVRENRTTEEDRKVTIVSQPIKPKPKKRFWCCGKVQED